MHLLFIEYQSFRFKQFPSSNSLPNRTPRMLQGKFHGLQMFPSFPNPFHQSFLGPENSSSPKVSFSPQVLPWHPVVDPLERWFKDALAILPSKISNILTPLFVQRPRQSSVQSGLCARGAYEFNTCCVWNMRSNPTKRKMGGRSKSEGTLTTG